ncbi:hypothetical protein KCV07_g54, partial [Aureobasidium melanogenum]
LLEATADPCGSLGENDWEGGRDFEHRSNRGFEVGWSWEGVAGGQCRCIERINGCQNRDECGLEGWLIRIRGGCIKRSGLVELRDQDWIAVGPRAWR